jgi:hypothetical protein
LSSPELLAEEPEHSKPSEIVAGYLASFSIFASLISLAWHPLRLVGPAIVLAMISAGMAGKRRLPFAAVIVAAVCFFLGLMISVIAERPLW